LQEERGPLWVNVLQETKQFVDPIKEIQFNVTSNGVKIANSGESFFGETLFTLLAIVVDEHRRNAPPRLMEQGKQTPQLPWRGSMDGQKKRLLWSP
jgi:hypothetical protein